MKLIGPYETVIIVHITDGKRAGVIDVNLSMGEPPTRELIESRIEEAKAAAEKNGMRLMNKSEFFHAMMRERAGCHEKFAIPGGEEWDKP